MAPRAGGGATLNFKLKSGGTRLLGCGVLGLMLVEAVHAAILLAQLAAGLLLSDAPLLWLASYATLCAGLCGGLLLLALLSSAIFPACGPHLQPAAPRSRVLAEALESCRAMVVFSGFAAWPRTMRRCRVPRTGDPRHQPARQFSFAPSKAQAGTRGRATRISSVARFTSASARRASP